MAEDERSRLHEDFLAHYAAHIADGSRPFEGIPELLDRLADAGARLAVCTNKYERLSRELLAELGPGRQFGAIAGRDTFAMCKPEAGHLTGTIDMAGGRPNARSWSATARSTSPPRKAAGIPAIGVTFGYTPRPVRERCARMGVAEVIDHYREFVPALERAAAVAGAALTPLSPGGEDVRP